MSNEVQNRRPSAKQIRKRRKRSKAIVFLSLAVIFIALIGILSLTVFFKTASVTVDGRSVYSNEQIINVSGIEIGDNMFKSLINNAEGTIVKALPYIETADIKRELSGDVVISVTPASSAYCFEIAGGYLLCSANFKALEKVQNPSDNLPLISGAELDKQQPGEKITFADKEKGIILREILSCAKNSDISLTSVGLSAADSKITFTVDGRITVDLGTGADIAYKMVHVKECLEKIPENESGTISFSIENSKRAYFRKNTSSTEENSSDQP